MDACAPVRRRSRSDDTGFKLSIVWLIMHSMLDYWAASTISVYALR